MHCGRQCGSSLCSTRYLHALTDISFVLLFYEAMANVKYEGDIEINDLFGGEDVEGSNGTSAVQVNQ